MLAGKQAAHICRRL